MEAYPAYVGDSSLCSVGQLASLAHIFRMRGMIPLPNNYLVLDIETTALQPAYGYILQLGYALVTDGKIAHNSAIYLETPEAELQAYATGSYVRRQIAAGNEGYVKADDVRKKGVPCQQVLSMLAELIEATMQLPNAVIVGHNIAGFDIPFIEHFSARNGVPIKFDRGRVMDTGALFKASKLDMIPPDDGSESLFDWFLRVKNRIAKGVFWRIDVAIDELGLESRFGITKESAHDAGFDTLATHYLYQVLRDKVQVAAEVV